MKKLILTILFLSVSTASFADREVIGEWEHEAKRDKMKDLVTCGVRTSSHLSPSPYFFFQPGDTTIGAIAKLYPGKRVTVRIDKNQTVEQKDYIFGDNSKVIIEQIRAGGKQMLMQVIEWPSGAPYVMTINLDGVLEHLDACAEAVKAQ